MPYISASIVIQLLTVSVAYFQKMQKEGDSGRKKINQITRVLTIGITLVQASAYIGSTIPSEAIVIEYSFFLFSSIVILTAGTLFCMWLGEKITEKGIGNGISMLIMIGIISRFPGSFIAEAASKGSQVLLIVMELIALFFVVVAVILLTQGVRRVPVEYAKQVASGVAKKKSVLAKGQRSYIPLKVNAANVMPIIFAQSLMFLPPLIASTSVFSEDTAQRITAAFTPSALAYNVSFAVLILLFTFFYTAITVNPVQMAEDMKRNSAFVPGVKPGVPTSDFISNIIDRITLPGALFLAFVAILPAFATMAGVGDQFAQFYGGTSLIIMVGVIFDTLQQIESHLLMKHYEGMMKTGDIANHEGVAVAS